MHTTRLKSTNRKPRAAKLKGHFALPPHRHTLTDTDKDTIGEGRQTKEGRHTKHRGPLICNIKYALLKGTGALPSVHLHVTVANDCTWSATSQPSSLRAENMGIHPSASVHFPIISQGSAIHTHIRTNPHVCPSLPRHVFPWCTYEPFMTSKSLRRRNLGVQTEGDEIMEGPHPSVMCDQFLAWRRLGYYSLVHVIIIITRSSCNWAIGLCTWSSEEKED